MFQTRDGHINIAAAGDEIWERFCEALERARAGDASRTSRPPALRSKNRDALNAEIER